MGLFRIPFSHLAWLCLCARSLFMNLTKWKMRKNKRKKKRNLFHFYYLCYATSWLYCHPHSRKSSRHFILKASSHKNNTKEVHGKENIFKIYLHFYYSPHFSAPCLLFLASLVSCTSLEVSPFEWWGNENFLMNFAIKFSSLLSDLEQEKVF
jgi:hypothetical protein